MIAAKAFLIIGSSKGLRGTEPSVTSGVVTGVTITVVVAVVFAVVFAVVVTILSVVVKNGVKVVVVVVVGDTGFAVATVVASSSIVPSVGRR